MFGFIIKVAIIVVLVVLLSTHWDAVVAFFGGIIDWTLFYMDKIAAGPSR